MASAWAARIGVGLVVFVVAARLMAAADEGPEVEHPADAAIHAKIKHVCEAASHLRLDGLDPDWAEIPEFVGKRCAAGSDASREIKSLAIAPKKMDLWIMLRTAGTPSTAAYSFYFTLDLFGDRGQRLRIEIPTAGKPPSARLADVSGNLGKAVELPRSATAVRRVVELRIDYRDLTAMLPKDEAALITDAAARPWVRVGCESWNGFSKKSVDRGPSAASFRLLAEPYAIDTPLPESPHKAIVIDFPLRGLWYISQGAFGSYSHSDIWAYDFCRFDVAGQASIPPRSKNLKDYFAYGQPIVSPVEGAVRRVRSNIKDSPPLSELDPDLKANEIYIGSDDGYGVSLVHLGPDSATVKMGDRVTVGQELAAVGNSGASDAPHLHLRVWSGLYQRSQAPATLRNVRVGLNPAEADPWARDLSAWSPRQGYFVAPLAKPETGKDANAKREGEAPAESEERQERRREH